MSPPTNGFRGVNEGEKGEFVFNGYEANPDAPLPKVKDVAAPALRAVTIFAALPPFPASQQPSTKKTIEFAQRLATAFWITVQLVLSMGRYVPATTTMSYGPGAEVNVACEIALAFPNIDIRVKFAAPTTLSNSFCKFVYASIASAFSALGAVTFVVSNRTFCAKAC